MPAVSAASSETARPLTRQPRGWGGIPTSAVGPKAAGNYRNAGETNHARLPTRGFADSRGVTATLNHPSPIDSIAQRVGPPRVLILEPDSTVLSQLMAAVDADPGLQLVTVTGDTSSLIGLVSDLRPDVALVNSRPDEGGGGELVQRLRDAFPEICCIALCRGADQGELAEMLAAGAVASVDPTDSAQTITEAIHRLTGSTPDPEDELAGASSPNGHELNQADPVSPTGEHTVAGQVKRTLELREFEMVFQAIVDLQDGQVIGMEALTRVLSTPLRSPATWLRDAQKVGLRNQLEIELLREALGQGRRLPPGVFMTVNLSPAAATCGALVDVIPPALLKRVVIEITDHLEVEDYQPLAEALAELRGAGVRVAVDDSGQGLVSLQRVGQLAPDFVKLNRSLTRDINRDQTRQTLALALTTVASQIGAAVIAEGIETSGELEALRSLGVMHGQGYLIARPEPLPDAPTPVIALPSAKEPTPAISLPARSLGSLREASRAAFDLLERELPGSRGFVSHLDYEQRRARVVASSPGFGTELAPGVSTRLEEWPCYFMASGRGPRLCGDTASDPVYSGLGLLQTLDVASYAGAPLELGNGQWLGSLALVSRAIDGYDEETLALLQVIAATLVGALENEVAEAGAGTPAQHIRQLAATDWLTGVLNRPSFLERLEQETSQSPGRRHSTYLLHLAPDSFGALADRYGQAVAELVVKDIADALVRVSEGGDVIGRLGQTEFAVLLRRRTAPKAASYYRRRLKLRLRQTLAKRNITLTARAGLLQLDGHSHDEALEAVRAAAGALL